MENNIHETAIISENVVIGKGNTIGPYSVIHDGVTIGDNNEIGSFVVIGGRGEIRKANEFKGRIYIGDDNLINHHVTIDKSIEGVTYIGDKCFIMTKAHLGHDVKIYDSVTISSGANIGGHVFIDDNANVGLNAEIHQRLKIGQGAMIGMGSSITKDVYPFIKIVGVNRIIGYNDKKIKELDLSMIEVRKLGREFGE
jgi:UDP-N-acetylglucosamine acyltransferase